MAEQTVGRHHAYELDAAFIHAWQWGDPVLRNVTDLLVKAAAGRQGRALVVGCGTGREAVALAQVGWRVEALDIDAKVIDIARAVSAHLGVTVDYRVADFSAERADYADASYDLVVCIEVLEHVPAWQDALANLRRVLRPGGLLFLTVPHDPRQFSVLDAYAGHLRRFRRQEVLAELAGMPLSWGTVGFPSFRTITWIYDRALRLTGRKHQPQSLRGRSGLGLLAPKVMYGLSKFDNLFSGLGWGTTLVIRAVQP